jgi:hypothetical protein
MHGCHSIRFAQSFLFVVRNAVFHGHDPLFYDEKTVHNKGYSGKRADSEGSKSPRSDPRDLHCTNVTGTELNRKSTILSVSAPGIILRGEVVICGFRLILSVRQ